MCPFWSDVLLVIAACGCREPDGSSRADRVGIRHQIDSIRGHGSPSEARAGYSAGLLSVLSDHSEAFCLSSCGHQARADCVEPDFGTVRSGQEPQRQWLEHESRSKKPVFYECLDDYRLDLKSDFEPGKPFPEVCVTVSTCGGHDVSDVSRPFHLFPSGRLEHLYRPVGRNVSPQCEIFADHVTGAIESVCAVDDDDSSPAAVLRQECIHNVTKLLHLSMRRYAAMSFNENLRVLYPVTCYAFRGVVPGGLRQVDDEADVVVLLKDVAPAKAVIDGQVVIQAVPQRHFHRQEQIIHHPSHG